MNKYFLIIILSLIPSVFWLLGARFIDKKKPEPRKQIFKFFISGCLIVLPTFVLVQGVKYFFSNIDLSPFLEVLIFSFFIDGLIEEFAKFIIIKDFVYRSKFFDEPLDGFVYGVTIAMGFAFVENFLYLLTSRPELIILRFTTPTLMHALAGGIIGYHVALAKFKQVSANKKRFYIFTGLILAIIFHGLYNSVIRYDIFFSAIPLTILIVIIYIYLLRGLRKAQKIPTIPEI